MIRYIVLPVRPLLILVHNMEYVTWNNLRHPLDLILVTNISDYKAYEPTKDKVKS